MRNYLLLIRVALLLLLCFPLCAYAEQKPSLRDLFEGRVPAKVKAKAGADDVIVVDLEEWENEYDETLTIGNGKKYKFTNGELKWIGGDAPLIVVTNGSYVEFTEGVNVSGGAGAYREDGLFYTYVGLQSSLIILRSATVYVKGAIIGSHIKSVWDHGQNLSHSFEIDPQTDNNMLVIEGGSIGSGIQNESLSPNNKIIINNGAIEGVQSYSGIDINGYICIPGKGITGYYVTSSIKGVRLGKNGILRVKSYIEKPRDPNDDPFVEYYDGSTKLVQSVYVDSIYDGRVVAQGLEYTLTEADLSWFSVGSPLFTGNERITSKKDKDFYLALEDNQVIIRKSDLSPKQTIHVAEPGTLPSLLTDAAIDVVTELTVTGDLNADDLAFLERMGKAKLEVLNMADANIVKGGMAKVGTWQNDFSFSPEHPDYPGGFVVLPLWEGTLKDTIPSFAFAECDKLREVMLPHSVKCIEEGVLSKCQQLQNVTIGRNTNVFGYGLCFRCSELRSVKSASSGIIIQDGIIYNADQSVILSSISSFLKSEEIIIPASVKDIQRYAFNSNAHIKILHFENSNDTIEIGRDAFAGSGLRHVYVNRPCELSYGVFYSCSDLTSISFSGMRSLPQGCLENCPNLKELVIPEGAEYVGRYACYNSGIEKLTLPSTLNSLGHSCFAGNTRLKNIYSNAKTPPSISGGEGWVSIGTFTSFSSVDHETCVVHVPSGCVHAYKLDIERKQMEESGVIWLGWGNGWCDFKNIVCDKGNLKDLFNIVDPNASEDDPTNAMEGTDDVDVDEPHPGKPDLHLLFGDDSNDIPEGTEPKKDLHFLFDGEYGLTIPKTSSYEFKNINIDLGSHSIDHVIYVEGTLIININVYFINITEYVKHVIYIRKGGRVIFRGGRHDIPGVVIHNEGGTIIYEGGDSHGGTHGVVNNGGTVTINGGTIGGNGNGVRNTGGGTVTITGGHIYGGGTISGGTPGGSTPGAGHVIYSDGGRVNILGGDYDEGSSVWSEGSLWLDGSVTIRDYYIRRNITIYIVNRIIVNWYFYFIDETEINCGIPLFKGDGYTLTEEDLSRIYITLPAGYELVLDKTINAIIIVNTTGIDGVATDSKTPKAIYSPSGTSLSAPRKGLNIIDGKKVLVK